MFIVTHLCCPFLPVEANLLILGAWYFFTEGTQNAIKSQEKIRRLLMLYDFDGTRALLAVFSHNLGTVLWRQVGNAQVARFRIG